MEKKIYGYNLSIDTKIRFDEIAKSKHKSASALLNEVLSKFVEEFEEKVEEKKDIVQQPRWTEEERLADWEWRKQQVLDGKLPAGYELEYPKTSLMEGQQSTKEFNGI